VRFNVSLSDIVQWFKIMTTAEYIRGVKQSGWPPFRKRIWQRSYYERIIRDDEPLARIRHYIADNPARWAEDNETCRKGRPHD
jgi:REP element-mobilizing transposase RayT